MNYSPVNVIINQQQSRVQTVRRKSTQPFFINDETLSGIQNWHGEPLFEPNSLYYHPLLEWQKVNAKKGDIRMLLYYSGARSVEYTIRIQEVLSDSVWKNRQTEKGKKMIVKKEGEPFRHTHAISYIVIN